MTTAPGRPFRIARSVGASEGRVILAVVAVGVLVSLGLIAVSAILNFRMGYRSADTELDGWVYGAGAGLGDALKAIAPFMIFWGIRNRDWLAALCAAILFVVFTAYSFTAALGFAADHRANKAAVTLRAIERRGDLRKAKSRVDARLEQLGPQRSSLEVEQAIVAAYRQRVGKTNRTVGDISARCTLNRSTTRTACETIMALSGELARAEESEKLLSEASGLRAQLGEGKAAPSSADSQVDALKRLADLAVTVEPDDVGLGLSFLLALFIELGSGLGLYIATTPYRTRHEGQRGTPGRQPMLPKSQHTAKRFADVDTYAVERLEPAKGEVGLPDLYADYVVWARWRGEIPLGRRAFGKRFSDLATAAGMRNLYRNRTEIYVDVGLVGR